MEGKVRGTPRKTALDIAVKEEAECSIQSAKCALHVIRVGTGTRQRAWPMTGPPSPPPEEDKLTYQHIAGTL